MRKLRKHIILAIFLSLVLIPYIAFARVSGVCSNCHTMHASQHGVPEEPSQSLLVDSCVGCHSSSSSSTYYELGTCNVPVVLYTGGAAPTSYLAGGNFWWVKRGQGYGGDDTKGHNVFYGEGDGNLSAAPGDLGFARGCASNNCHQNLHLGYEGNDELNGKYGCQGCHLRVKHHARDHANGQGGLVDSWDQGYYRFLSGHMSGGCMDWPDCTRPHGVEGYEHGLWEAGLHDGGDHQGATDHNEYLGFHQVGGPGSGYGFALGHTTTAFCTGCHGMFHQHQKEVEGGSWVRHPSDFEIQNKGEYAVVVEGSYPYDPLSPVARPSLSDPPSDPGHVHSGDMVMCLSCHRPHGSPYPDLLRWDYTQQIAGGGGDDKGCFYCHTQKND